MSPNLKAVLDAIAGSEGTRLMGNDGYNVLFGSTVAHPRLFDSYDDHPRVHFHFGNGKATTAAGRYQILERIYDGYKPLLGLQNFAPPAQDAIAYRMIEERAAVPDFEQGWFDDGLFKIRKLWASLPGAGYSQHENTLEDLRRLYVAAGGKLATG